MGMMAFDRILQTYKESKKKFGGSDFVSEKEMALLKLLSKEYYDDLYGAFNLTFSTKYLSKPSLAFIAKYRKEGKSIDEINDLWFKEHTE